MNDKELRRGEVLGRVKRGEFKLSEAARMLDASYRQTKRIWRRYSAGGTKALKHGNTGRVSNRAKPAEVRKRVLQLVREHYSGGPHERFGPTLAAEHLWTDHDLKLSVRTRRRWMLAAGLAIPNRSSRSPERRRRQKKRWFRQGQKWRTGSEGGISLLQRRQGLNRCRYRGEEGMQRWVGLGVIADNLINIGRHLAACDSR